MPWLEVGNQAPRVLQVRDELATGKARDLTASPDHSPRMQSLGRVATGDLSLRSMHGCEKLDGRTRSCGLGLACGIYFYLLHFILFADREWSLPQQSSPSLYFSEEGGRGDSEP